MNEMLYEKYITKYPNDKKVLDKCLEKIDKELFQLNLEEIKDLVSKFLKSEQKIVIKIGKRYVDMAIFEAYIHDTMNLFEVYSE